MPAVMERNVQEGGLAFGWCSAPRLGGQVHAQSNLLVHLLNVSGGYAMTTADPGSRDRLGGWGHSRGDRCGTRGDRPHCVSALGHAFLRNSSGDTSASELDTWVDSMGVQVGHHRTKSNSPAQGDLQGSLLRVPVPTQYHVSAVGTGSSPPSLDLGRGVRSEDRQHTRVWQCESSQRLGAVYHAGLQQLVQGSACTSGAAIYYAHITGGLGVNAPPGATLPAHPLISSKTATCR